MKLIIKITSFNIHLITVRGNYLIYTPISKFLDWLSAFLNFLLIPFSIIFIMIFFISFLSESEAIYLMSITILLLLFIMVNYYRINYNKLTKFATDTHYVHFKPSHKDLILSFYGQVFVVIILMVLILLFLSNWLINADSWNFLFLSFSIALILQCFTVFLINKAKIKLIDTANEPVDHSIISAMNKRTKDVLKIKNFAFADIKPASLFLSAGVTNYSFNSNICLISRYFQWKLSENELLSVIGHEIGHVVHRDLLQSQLLFTNKHPIFFRSKIFKF